MGSQMQGRGEGGGGAQTPGRAGVSGGYYDILPYSSMIAQLASIQRRPPVDTATSRPQRNAHFGPATSLRCTVSTPAGGPSGPATAASTV